MVHRGGLDKIQKDLYKINGKYLSMLVNCKNIVKYRPYIYLDTLVSSPHNSPLLGGRHRFFKDSVLLTKI
jgi:hypothetical protein